MIRIGLTGSIGMGKSTVARMFAAAGVPVFDADGCSRALTAPGGAALPAVAAAFPRTVTDGVLDRAALGARVFADPAALRRLEAILHPMVQAGERRFLRRCALARVPLALCDIPLLFETRAEARFDVVVVVTASPALQALRVLRRPGMTAARLAEIRGRQWPEAAKRRAADAVIHSGRSLGHTRRAVRRLVGALRRGERAGRVRRHA